jgi:hypothetical protein
MTETTAHDKIGNSFILYIDTLKDIYKKDNTVNER